VRKIVLSLFILLIAAGAMGQKKSIVNLLHSKSSTGIKIGGKDLIKVYDGTFKQDYSTLTSDSAYFYVQDNAVDAFGHVVINQGDTLHIYADKLNYNGNTKIAILTDNVKMVDKDAVLTTNHLTYNTATRIATYTDGGKLVNKDNILLSKNGYYFAFTRDSYFRYNVTLTTPDALVKTDTMRYNTGTKISYFYGPTHIYSIKKGEAAKDRDTLYTENGFYNTVVEQAAFGKNNLYKSGTKSLKGDSLFYDKIKGYGRAVKHVTFSDSEQKTTIKGDLGTYFKADEKTIVTEDPYIIMVTEQKDSTKTDSTAKVDSLTKAPAKNKNAINMAELIKKTIPGKADSAAKVDSLTKTPAKNKNAINMAELIKKTIPGKPDTATVKKANISMRQLKADSVVNNKNIAAAADLVKSSDLSTMDTAAIRRNIQQIKPDSVTKQLALAQGQKKTTPPLKKQAKITKPKTTGKATDKAGPPANVAPLKKAQKMKYDSIYMSADTIETRILTYKDYKAYLEQQRLSRIRDTTPKPKKPGKESKFLTGHYAWLPADTSFYRTNYFGAPKPKPVKKKVVKPLTKQQLMADSIAKQHIADSIEMVKKLEPADTARIRMVLMYHHAKLFKSDLQAKADSMFYNTADSTVSCFVNPIIWTEGSQLSGDTVFLQMKHKKLDNMTMFPNAFIVNIEKTDSLHFNQIAGKRMRGYFKDDKLNKMDIIGNAESIYFTRDSGKMTISGMSRSISSRIHVNFKDNKATDLAFYTKPQDTYGPLKKFQDDEKILKGFIWKPKERPASKEAIIPSYNRKKKPAVKPPAVKPKTGKPPGKNVSGGKTAQDSTLKTQPLKQDSILKKGDVKLPGANVKKDSTVKDSALKTKPVKLPGMKVKKDSTVKSN